MRKPQNRNQSPFDLTGKLTDLEAAAYIVMMTKDLMNIARSRHFDGLADMLRDPYYTAFAILSADGGIPEKAARVDQPSQR